MMCTTTVGNAGNTLLLEHAVRMKTSLRWVWPRHHQPAGWQTMTSCFHQSISYNSLYHCWWKHNLTIDNLRNLLLARQPKRAHGPLCKRHMLSISLSVIDYNISTANWREPFGNSQHVSACKCKLTPIRIKIEHIHFKTHKLCLRDPYCFSNEPIEARASKQCP